MASSICLALTLLVVCCVSVFADINAPTFSRYVSPGISTLPTNSVIRYVSSSGSDSNDGTSLSTPWKTLSHASSTVTAGTTVYVRGGTYAERLAFSHAGTANAWIIFVNYQTERPHIDGSTLTVSTSGNADALVTFNSGTAFIALVGFEISNFITSTDSALPVGIWIQSSGSTTIHDLLIRNNTIHKIYNLGTSDSTNGFGMAVYGKSATAITGITFDYNEVYDTITGQSETCTFNGNVDGFRAAFNYIHDTNNIGLDAIGAEGTAPSNDFARNGVFYGNVVANITSNINPTYGAGSISADGIYVDGGQNILIDSNIIVAIDIGIEIASEHSGHGAINCTAQNNIIWGSRQTGITVGGYDTKRGYAQAITIQKNYLWNNNYDSSGSGELNFNYDIRSMTVSGNVFYDSDVAGEGDAVFISSPFTKESGIVMSGNTYEAPSSLSVQWNYKNNAYSSLSSWKTAIGSESGSVLNRATVNGICGLLPTSSCQNGVPIPVAP